MNLVIVIAGVAGLIVAAYGLVTLSMSAWRRRSYGEIVLAVAVFAGTVYLLVVFGDRLIR